MTQDSNNETTTLILDTASKIFADHCDKALLDNAERGEFSATLWALIRENGFHLLGTAESGTEQVKPVFSNQGPQGG